MKTTFFTLMMLAITCSAMAQKLVARNGHIRFYSHTPVEDIEANNRQVVSILDPATGELVFNLLIKSFEFKVALMQEHFNENYMESTKYPKASFKGTIANPSGVNLQKDGTYPVEVSGSLTIREISKPVKATGTIEVKNGKVSARSTFLISPSDYNISIPQLVENKIARQIEVTVDVTYGTN